MSILERLAGDSPRYRPRCLLLALVAGMVVAGTGWAVGPVTGAPHVPGIETSGVEASGVETAASLEALVTLFDLVASGRRTQAGVVLGELFSEGFLQDVGTQSILRTVQRIADEHGAVQAVSATPEPNEYELLFSSGMALAVSLHLERGVDEAPRIGGIQLGRARPLERLLQDRVERLAMTHGETTVFVAPFGGDALFELGGGNASEGASGDSRQSRDRRPAEQSVVMYTEPEMESLRLVLRMVAGFVERRMELSNVVRLNAAHMADSGPLSGKAPGTPYTLYSLSEYLLFEHDETARRHIEAALRAQGGRAAAEINWNYRSLFELLERSTVLGGRSYSPIDHLFQSFFFVKASGADAAAVMLVPGRDGSTHYVAVSQHDPHQTPDPDLLRRNLELLAVPLRLLP